MKKKTWLSAMAAAVLLTACIPSVNPFYTDKDILTAPSLAGEWQEQNGDETPDVWKFEATEDRSYKLTLTDGKGKTGEFKAVLFQLGDYRFLDITPTECNFADDQIDLVAASIFPGHLLIHVAQLEPELKMAFCDYDWLGKYLDSNPAALKYRKQDDSTLLTADTSDLQRFVLEHTPSGELFDDYSSLVRKTNSPAATPATGR